LIDLVSPLCSNKEDFILYMIKKLLLKFALRFGFKKLLLGTNALSVASKTMSEISKGWGMSLPHLIHFVDNWYPEDTVFMNPIKDFLEKEIAIYIKLHDV